MKTALFFCFLLCSFNLISLLKIKSKQLRNGSFAFYENGVIKVDKIGADNCSTEPIYLEQSDCSSYVVWSEGQEYNIGDIVTVDYAIFQAVEKTNSKPKINGEVCLTLEECSTEQTKYMLVGSCLTSDTVNSLANSGLRSMAINDF